MAKMTNIVNKVWEALGMGQKQGEEIDEEELDSQAQVEDVYALDNEPEDEEEAKGLFGRKANARNLPMSSNSQVKMVITQPTEFEEASEICILLRQRKSIVMNLEYANKDVARRIVDTVSGAVVVLDGKILKISNSIFLVAPNNYDIDEGSNEDIKKNPLASFMNK